MEYSAIGSMSAAAQCIPDAGPADLSSLRSYLEDQVQRAHALASRARGIGDVVFGPRPAADVQGIGTAPSSISGLVNELASALGDIDSAISRL